MLFQTAVITGIKNKKGDVEREQTEKSTIYIYTHYIQNVYKNKQ